MTKTTNTASETGLTTTEGQKGPRVVKHLDVRIQEAREAVKAAEGRLKKLEAEKASEGLYDSVVEGQVYEFNYGRGEKARVLTGVVLVRETGKGSSNKVRFSSGTGFDAAFYDVTAAAINFPASTAE